MKTYIHGLLFALLFTPALWACDSGISTTYFQAYATASGNNVFTSVQAHVVGPDSEYDVITIKQTDTLSGVQYVSPFTGSSPSPGSPASTSRSSSISTYGYGYYQVQGYVSVHDTCNGNSYPPYTNGGSPYTNVAQVIVWQLKATVTSPVYVADFESNPYSGGATSVPVYPHTVGFGSAGVTDSTSPVPTWTFTGNVSDFDISCTVCRNPFVTPKATAHGSCSVALTGSFMWNGRPSASASLILAGPHEQTYSGPNGLEATHLAKSGGYESDWYYEILDSCGTPMEGLPVHEAFPSGFSYADSSYNWNFPSPNSWQSGAAGGWFDNIGQVNATNPPSLNPQTPLGNVLVYYGTQNIFVDPYTIPIDTLTQAHYQDHGGYK
jgi:hypothetical protein